MPCHPTAARLCLFRASATATEEEKVFRREDTGYWLPPRARSRPAHDEDGAPTERQPAPWGRRPPSRSIAGEPVQPVLPHGLLVSRLAGQLTGNDEQSFALDHRRSPGYRLDHDPLALADNLDLGPGVQPLAPRITARDERFELDQPFQIS